MSVLSNLSDISYLLFCRKLGIIVYTGKKCNQKQIRKMPEVVKEENGRSDIMLNFEEELEKFQPSVDVEKVEDVVYNNNLTDVTDIVKELIQDVKGTL